jgi:hypothetical protein
VIVFESIFEDKQHFPKFELIHTVPITLEYSKMRYYSTTLPFSLFIIICSTVSADNLRIRKNYGKERFVADWELALKDKEPERKVRLLREKDKKPFRRMNNFGLQNSNSNLFAELANVSYE